MIILLAFYQIKSIFTGQRNSYFWLVFCLGEKRTHFRLFLHFFLSFVSYLGDDPSQIRLDEDKILFLMELEHFLWFSIRLSENLMENQKKKCLQNSFEKFIYKKVPILMNKVLRYREIRQIFEFIRIFVELFINRI